MKADNFKINLNQNIWILIVSLIALGISEYYNLCTLYYFGFFLSIIASVSVLITLFFYTFNYSKNKIK